MMGVYQLSNTHDSDEVGGLSTEQQSSSDEVGVYLLSNNPSDEVGVYPLSNTHDNDEVGGLSTEQQSSQ